MNGERLTLEELELSSFVTSLPEEAQMAIAGACNWRYSFLRDGTMWEAGKYLLQKLGDWAGSQEMAGGSGTLNTQPGFFDTSYPCG